MVEPKTIARQRFSFFAKLGELTSNHSKAAFSAAE
jgi:hypothetical protein